MTTIPQVFYAQKTPSGDNFGRIFARLFLDLFEINEATVSQFRNEARGDHIQFELLSEEARFSTTLHKEVTVDFRSTHLSRKRYQCTIAKKNVSIIKNDLLPYLRHDVVVKDLMPNLMFSLTENIQYKQHLIYYIYAALPSVKELVVRYLLAFEKNEIGFDEDVINFIDFFYLFAINLNKPYQVLQHSVIYYDKATYTDHDKLAKKIKRKGRSLLVRFGLVNKQKHIQGDLHLLAECLRKVSTQSQVDHSPKSIYQALPQLKVLFENI